MNMRNLVIWGVIVVVLIGLYSMMTGGGRGAAGAHEVTYSRLRDMILFGALAPGQPVTIQGLTTELETGMTPVREAIRRLAAEGALMLQGNRRVSVPQMTESVLDQLAWARLAIEPQLARLAMRAIGPKPTFRE